MPTIAGSTFQPGPTAANTSGLPFITLGSKSGSGANFDPGTNPTPGDTAGTDCAYAIQAALCYAAGAAAPASFPGLVVPAGPASYTSTTPAVIQLIPGTYRCWNSGTTPTSFLIMSGEQTIIGSNKNNPLLTAFSASLKTFTLPLSGSASPALTAPAYVRINPGTETSGSATTTGVTIVAYNGATATPVTGIYLLGIGDTITPTYAGGSPTMDSSVPFMCFNVQPSSWKMVGIQFKGAVAWADSLDSAFNPAGTTGGGAYAETGGNAFYMENVRSVVTVTNNVVTNFMLDGMEAGMLFQCQGVNFSLNTANGYATVMGGIWASCSIMGQQIDLYSVDFNAPITIPNNSVQGNTMTTTGVGPCQINLDNVYFNGVTGSPLIQNNQSAAGTIINVKGGFWKAQGNPAAIIIGNESTTTLNLFGGTTFVDKTSTNKPPLFSAVPAGVFIGGAVTVAGNYVTNEASLLANTQYANNAARSVAGYSTPQVVLQVAGAAAVTLGTASTQIASLSSASVVTGLYRVTVNITHVSASQSGTVTCTYTDLKSNATATQTTNYVAAGAGVSISMIFLCNAKVGVAITTAGTVAAASDAYATCTYEAL